MNLQQQVAEIRSLAPIQALSPIFSIQRKPWYKVYRAECMIPLPMYSIKVVYIITFIAFKIYVRVELYLIPMVYPNAFPIEYPGTIPPIEIQAPPIPIACYSYNCIYCARCGLGISCKSHVPGYSQPQQMVEEKKEARNEEVTGHKMEQEK